jgi:hypothetical protein
LSGGVADRQEHNTVNTFPEGFCPLCSQVYLREHLQSHIAGELERVREKTIQVIQAYHHGWAVEHGACETCWKSFRDAGRILNLLKQMKPQRPAHRWKDAASTPK